MYWYVSRPPVFYVLLVETHHYNDVQISQLIVASSCTYVYQLPQNLSHNFNPKSITQVKPNTL